MWSWPHLPGPGTLPQTGTNWIPLLADRSTAPFRPHTSKREQVAGPRGSGLCGLFCPRPTDGKDAKYLRLGCRFLTARVAGQQRHSSRHSLTFRPVGKGMPRRCTRCSATDSAAAGGGAGGVLGSDGAAATRVRWAVAGLSFRFGAASLRVVVSLA